MNPQTQTLQSRIDRCEQLRDDLLDQITRGIYVADQVESGDRVHAVLWNHQLLTEIRGQLTQLYALQRSEQGSTGSKVRELRPLGQSAKRFLEEVDNG
jgi:hypothetical protein